MATLDLHEQEQVDAIKNWWAENGKWVLTAVIAAVLGYAGIQFWKNYQIKQSEGASKLYVEVEKQLGSGDVKRLNDAVAALVDQFGRSAFAPRAQLLAAQANLKLQDFSRAKTQLQWVVDHANESGLQATATLKLASVLLDEKNYDAALKLLNGGTAESFKGLYADLKGDILFAQGKLPEAKVAYQSALALIDAKSNYHNLVQLKLDGLGVGK